MGTGGQHKVEYKEWQRWREDINTLREVGYSWTELSVVLGHSESGYVSHAYEHRAILEPDTIRRTRELVKSRAVQELLKKKQPQPPQGEDEGDDSEERKRQAREVKDALVELGLTVGEIGVQAFGYSNANSLTSALAPSGTGPPWDRIKQAQAYLQQQNGKPSREEEPKPADPWGWIDEVRDALLEQAVKVEQHATLVPEAFRGPFKEKVDALVNLADKEFRR